MKKNIRLLYFSLIASIVFLTSITNVTGKPSRLTTSLQLSDDWIPGNALGQPGFVGYGNFTNKEFDEILLVSRIPGDTDAMTLCYYDGVNLTVEGSKDKDFSTVYYEMIADFDGDGDDEVLVSEDWATEMGAHLGSVHHLFDYKDFRFVKNTSCYYSNPDIIIDRGLAVDLDENNDSELILATWDSEDNTELVRVYNYVNETFVQITNITYQLLEVDIYYRSILYLGFGDFNGDSQQELIVFSKWTYNYAPGTFFYSFEVYSYDNNLQQITHEFSGRINIFESELDIFHSDIDQDGKDELFVYYDRVTEPMYSVYEISTIEVKMEFEGTRFQSNYGTTDYYVIDIIPRDVNLDGVDEIIFIEANNDFEGEFKGRVEIYQYSSNNIESICLESFLKSPTDVFVADINTNSAFEIVTVYNDYSDEFLAKGGIEIWSIIDDESNRFPIFSSVVDYLLIIGGPILLLTIITMKRKSK
ncbi:MAG: hypothetical protein ACTSPT_04565 [Candidatus Heimdallarchaeota archaeon]